MMKEFRCLLNAPGLRVSYDAANGWLYTQWRGKHDEASTEAGAEAVRRCLHTQPCTKILSNHSQLRGKWQAAPPSAIKHALSHLAAQGIAYFAWVYSPCYTDQAAMERAICYTTMPVVGIFQNLVDAYEWLQSCPVGPASSSLQRIGGPHRLP